MFDEGKLLRALQQGKKNSIEQAIELYTPYLSTVLFNMAGTKLPIEDIEEIISDTFVALWKNAGRIDLNKGTLRGYIAAVARNFALKRLNKSVEHTPLENAEIADIVTGVGDSLADDALWSTVMLLGEPDSEIFVRYYKYDQKLKDISAATGLNLSTVKTKLSRGKQKLRNILKDAEGLL